MSNKKPEYQKLIRKYERKIAKLKQETEDIVKGEYPVKHSPEWYLKKIESNTFKIYDLVEEITSLENENCI